MKISSIHYAGLANVLFENLKNPFGFVIGRADKRYTLWKYSRENDSITIAFVHVLSSSRPKIEFQFPGVYVCEELRGEHRMVFERRAAKAAAKQAAKDAAPKTPFESHQMESHTYRIPTLALQPLLLPILQPYAQVSFYALL